MGNAFMDGLTKANNYNLTANGALSHKSTSSALYDMFALGAAYRKRSEEDCILLFRNAFAENETYALKCLFYIRDVRGGQGERRFFRVCMRDLARTNPAAAKRNLQHIAEYGRWDDLLVFVGTPLETDALAVIKHQLAEDTQTATPSLLAKWLPSENTSSAETRALGNKVRAYLGMSHKQYRKTLSVLRTRINVLEKLMSENRWDEIEFDKIPSRAGILYKEAFERHDPERAQSKGVQTYADFAKDTTTKVNAKALYPYECVAEALKIFRTGSYWSVRDLPALDDTNRLMVNKYWDNLENYLQNKTLNALAVVDTSGSMVSHEAAAPINVAISLGLYCAEKAKGPFAGHYVSFSSRPQLIKTEGVDFVDKVYRIYKTNLCQNTNLEATFDMLLNTAIANKVKSEDLPKSIIVISDMEIDEGSEYRRGYSFWSTPAATRLANAQDQAKTMMEQMRVKWAQHGYIMPNLIYWNVHASNNTILDDGPNVSYVSGMSPTIFEQIMSGKTGYDLMMDKLNSDRYSVIE